MCSADRVGSVLLATAALLLLCSVASSLSVVVQNGFELHAALTSPTVNWILLADNVTLTLDTCPFPSSPEFPATVIDRNVTITSLSPATAARAAAAGDPLPQDPSSSPSAAAAAAARVPVWLDCSFLDARFTMTAGNTIVLDSVVLLNCRTVNTFGYVRMQTGSTLVLNNTVDFQGPPSVCIPLQVVAQLNTLFVRPQHLPTCPTCNSSQQFTAYTPANSNWCSAGATGQGIPGVQLPQQFLPLLMTNSTSYSICRQDAGLLGNFARTESPAPYQTSSNSTQEQRAAVDILWNRSVFLCREPLTGPCIGMNATDACIAEAFRALDPDRNRPCPASDAASLRTCLTTPSFTRILLIADIKLNASSSGFPPSMSDQPPIIGHNVTLESDPRGPRMVLDCALLADRMQVAAGVTIRTQHVVLANCSIGAEKPLSFLRFDQGSQLIVQDSYVLQPTNLCLPNQQQLTAFSTEPRPSSMGGPGSQQIRLGQPSAWCAASPTSQAPAGTNSTAVTVPATGSPQANTSYSRLPQVYANRTGLGPAYAATLEQPARAAFYTHPTWPRHQFCDDQVLLLVDYAYNDRFGWTQPGSAAATDPGAAPAPAARSTDSSNTTAQQQQQLPAALVDRLGTGYNGSLPVRYLNSTFICQQRSDACASTAGATNGTQSACLLAEYARFDPDAAAGAVAAAGGGNYGVSVILPAVLGSVVGFLLLAGIVGGFLLARRLHRRKQAKLDDAEKGPEVGRARQQADMMGVLFGTGHSDPNRRLLQSAGASPADTYSTATPAATSAGSSTVGLGTAAMGTLGMASTIGTAGSFLSTQGQGTRRSVVPQTGKQFAAPEDFLLGLAIGAGSFGRVYSGSWQGRPVAVKVISHSSADDEPISRELTLSTSFDHPNLVRTLHYARIRLNDDTRTAGLGAPGSSGGGSSSLLPQGAIGVFDLPSHWAVVQQHAGTDEPAIDTETWIVMDLMDRGTLASAVRRGMFANQADNKIKAAMLLRRCADVAAGLGYLHSRNVCHGDLKLENVLLRTEPQDPDGMMASVADFGLSRALALGQSHLSTRRYGTVTHMPPELLVSGKLTPAADIYSFGVMMWQMVSRVHPFTGLHHGEVIHRVVTEDLRPGPWPAEATTMLPAGYRPLAEACWERQRTKRPSAEDVLQQLLRMLSEVEGGST